LMATTPPSATLPSSRSADLLLHDMAGLLLCRFSDGSSARIRRKRAAGEGARVRRCIVLLMLPMPATAVGRYSPRHQEKSDEEATLSHGSGNWSAFADRVRHVPAADVRAE